MDIRIYFTSEDGALKDVSLKNFYEEHYVDIKLKDGNYIPSTGGGGGNNLGTRYYKHMSTVEYGEIELENIGSIVIGNLEIPVDLK